MSIFRKEGTALVNQGVVSATNFLTGIFIGRTCTTDEFGLYMLGFSIVLFAMDLQMALISTPYMIYSPRLKGDTLRLYNGSSLLHECALSIVLMLVLLICSTPLFFGIGPRGLASVVTALAATIGFIMFRDFVRRMCFANLRMETALLFDLCIATLQLGGIALLVHQGLLSAGRAYWVVGCACGVASAAWLFLNRAAFKIQVSQALLAREQSWQFGKWILAGSIVWTISMNLYPWLLTFFHGTVSAGVWAACLGVMAIANVPLVGMMNILGPKIANVYKDLDVRALRRYVFKSSAVLFVFMSAFCIVLYVVGERLLVLLYGDKYAGNGTVVVFMGLGLLVSGVAFSFSRALFVLERADVDFKVNAVPLGILFTLGLWLVKSYGPLGAALGIFIANVAGTGVRCACFAVLTRPSNESIGSRAPRCGSQPPQS